MDTVCKWILDYVLSFHVEENISRPQNIGPAPVVTYPSGFFDGATTKNLRGVGIYLLINQSHFFCIKLGCGLSTNTRVELLSLWVLLFFSKETGIPSLHVYGDSSVIINWENDKEKISALNLDAQCHNIASLKAHFLSIEFQHVYRENNEKEYKLYKEVLSMATILLSFTEYCE